MNEYSMIWYVPSMAVLFAAGGTWWKVLRRFGCPLVTYLALGLTLGFTNWWLVASCVALSVTLHMGYGGGTSNLIRFIVFTSYTLCALFIGWSLWMIVVPFILMGFFFLSNFKFGETHFVWKLWEMTAGALIAFNYAVLHLW